MLYQAILEAFVKFTGERMALYGKEALFNQPEFNTDAEKLKKVLSLLDNPDELRKAVKDSKATPTGIKVHIGSDEDGMVKEAEENKEADQRRKDDIEVKNKAQTYVDMINQTLVEKGDKMDAAQKQQLTALRDEANAAIQQNDINKLREIVGKLEDAAAAAQQAQAGQQGGAANGGPTPNDASNASANASSTEGKEGPDDVVDADFTDKKKD